MKNILDAIKYALIGDPAETKVIPTVDVQTDKMSFDYESPSFGDRIKKVMSGFTPNSSAQEKMPVPTTTPTPTPTPYQPTEVKSYEDFESVANPIFRKYDIPRPIGHGMYAAEGRIEGQGLGAKRNNFYNINAIDSDPNQAFGYKTPQEGIEAFAKLISGKYRLGDGTLDTRFLPAYNLRKDPVAMMNKIQELGYASRPDYANFVMSTPEWKSYYDLYYSK